MKRKTSPHQAALTDRTTIKVRFSEIDSMQIVWHGEYVRYFEDGREAFGKRYGLDYMSIYRASDQYIVATGTTTQVFLNTNRELELVNPAFYIEWKKKWNII